MLLPVTLHTPLLFPAVPYRHFVVTAHALYHCEFHPNVTAHSVFAMTLHDIVSAACPLPLFVRSQEVYSNSPAAKAGLQAYDDYILGTDSSLQEVR